MNSITILGATGSIGQQTLDIVAHNSELFKIDFLTTYSNITLLEKQCEKFNPNGVVIVNDEAYKKFKKETSFEGKILSGIESLKIAATSSDNNIVVSSLVGIAGLSPTIEAIKTKKIMLLANKEVLVVAGKYIMDLVKENGTKVIPIDSEHSAIYQCLMGEKMKDINKIILTASGGPFLKLNRKELKNVTIKDALNHPTWNMGTKVTIDSATMMNKGFEIIEAKWLFDVDIDKIDVIIHKQSIIHSMVEFIDGTIKSQLSQPDMHFPISFALLGAKRKENNYKKLDFNNLKKLDFLPVNKNKYPCLELAYYSMEKGGNSSAILNAANEIAVTEFINNRISFLDIPKIICQALNKIEHINNPSIEDLFSTDKETRIYTSSLV